MWSSLHVVSLRGLIRASLHCGGFSKMSVPRQQKCMAFLIYPLSYSIGRSNNKVLFWFKREETRTSSFDEGNVKVTL